MFAAPYKNIKTREPSTAAHTHNVHSNANDRERGERVNSEKLRETEGWDCLANNATTSNNSTFAS